MLAGFQMAADLGAIIGPVAAGAMAELVGFGPSFALTGAVALLAFVCWLGAPETLPRRTVGDGALRHRLLRPLRPARPRG